MDGIFLQEWLKTKSLDALQLTVRQTILPTSIKKPPMKPLKLKSETVWVQSKYNTEIFGDDFKNYITFDENFNELEAEPAGPAHREHTQYSKLHLIASLSFFKMVRKPKIGIKAVFWHPSILRSRCWVQNTSRIQNKKNQPPHFIYDTAFQILGDSYHSVVETVHGQPGQGHQDVSETPTSLVHQE